MPVATLHVKSLNYNGFLLISEVESVYIFDLKNMADYLLTFSSNSSMIVYPGFRISLFSNSRQIFEAQSIQNECFSH